MAELFGLIADIAASYNASQRRKALAQQPTRPGAAPGPGQRPNPGPRPIPGQRPVPAGVRLPQPGQMARPGVAPPRRGPARRPLPATMVAVAAPIMTGPSAQAPMQATRIAPARSATGTPAAAKPASAAAGVRRWLTPAALRQQVVLAEILRPPLALRED